jgi:hypothetical protein
MKAAVIALHHQSKHRYIRLRLQHLLSQRAPTAITSIGLASICTGKGNRIIVGKLVVYILLIDKCVLFVHSLSHLLLSLSMDDLKVVLWGPLSLLFVPP